MKIVLTTQYVENYGAHDWDGQGQCPQHWKFKGGETYIIENLTQAQANDFIQHQLTALYKLIEYSHEAAKEYVVSCEVCEDNHNPLEDWETANIISIKDDIFTMSCVSKNDEYGYMHKIISEKRESYQMMEQGKRENYKVEFLLTTGEVVNHEQMSQYLSQ